MTGYRPNHLLRRLLAASAIVPLLAEARGSKLPAASMGVASLTLMALLGGCGVGSGALGDSPTIEGQISNWIQGVGGYSLKATIGSTTLATVPMNNLGGFSITLPGSAAVGPLLTSLVIPVAAGCTGQVTVSPSTARWATAAFHATMGTSIQSVDLRSGAIGDDIDLTGVSYVYVDQDTSARGEITCSIGAASSSMSVSSISLHLARGWNTTVSHATGSVAMGRVLRVDLSSGPPPAGAQWLTHRL